MFRMRADLHLPASCLQPAAALLFCGRFQLFADINSIVFSNGTVTVGPLTGLDEITLQTLLSIDPLAVDPDNGTLPSPRFVANDLPSIGGSGTDVNGDILIATHEVTEVDINTTTTANVTTTDFKPGWIVALFGNTSTETQMTMNYSSAQQISVDQIRAATVHFFGDTTHPYVVGLQYDRLFGTIAFTSAKI